MGCGQENKENYYAKYLGFIKHDALTYSFEFTCDEIKTWKEGDHSMLIVPYDDILFGKKLCYASSPEEEVMRFTTRIYDDLSDFKKGLLNLYPGEFIKISEPSGNVSLKRESRPVVLLSNGVGIAGVRGLIRKFVENQSMITEMLQINVDGKSNIYKEEFDAYQKKYPNFKSYYVSHRIAYYSILYHELKMLMKRHDLDPIIYLAGSDDFVEENKNYLMDLDFSEDDILMGGKQSDACCRV
jgi:ferredoxin-NADP reductase